MRTLRRRSKSRWLITLLAGLVLIALLAVTISYLNRTRPGWSGFGTSVERVSVGKDEQVHYRPGKTLWDFLSLLIVPAVLAVAAYSLQQAARRREHYREDQRAQDAALQSYLDKMTDLLLDQSSASSDKVRVIMRSQTLAVLQALDGRRKVRILVFLREANLMGQAPLVDLRGANLDGVNLRGWALVDAQLPEVSLHKADLTGVDLSNANLNSADLTGANLSEAVLHGADLSSAKLDRALLSKSVFNVSRLTKDEAHVAQHLAMRQVSRSLTAVVSMSHKLSRMLSLELERRSAEMDVKYLKTQQRKTKQELQTFIEYGQSQVLEEALSSIPGLKKAAAERELERYKREHSPTAQEMREQINRDSINISEAEDRIARLTRANLNKASLREADLRYSDMRMVDLSDADLSNANLEGALLVGAVLFNADLSGARFKGVVLDKTQVSEDQLATVGSKPSLVKA